MRAAALLFVALASCGPSSIYHGDKSFSLEDRAIIEAASLVMSERVDGQRLWIVWDGGEEGDSRIVRMHRADKIGEYEMSTSDSAPTIWLDPSLVGNDLRRVTEHEFGHAHGLGHHGGVGLMASEVREWGAEDIAACRRAGKCEP